jgi:hypothetical protein
LERFASACKGLWRELFTRASFLIGQSRKQGDQTNRPAPYTHLQTAIEVIFSFFVMSLRGGGSGGTSVGLLNISPEPFV